MTAQGGYTATPSHSQVFYIDSGVTPKVDAMYVGYTITNTTGSTQSFWVSLSNFIGGKVSLANQNDQYQQVTNLATGQSKTVFYFLKSTGATTLAQTHTVKVWNKRPDISGATANMTCDFTFQKVVETIKASANKVGRVQQTLSPTTATLGGTIQITIDTNGNDKTQTGNLGAGSAPDFAAFWASPAAYSSWPTQALRLESTSISISCSGNTTLTLTNRLFASDATYRTTPLLASCISTGQGSQWTATYTFRIIGPSASTFQPAPIANISSGTQYKHTDLSAIGSNVTIDLTGVSSTALTVDVAAVKDTTTTTPAIPANYVRIKYTVTVSTTSGSVLQVDEVVDTHESYTGGGYISGSTTNKLGSASATTGPEPNVLASDASLTPPPQHFVGPFMGIVSGTAQQVIYSFDIPCDGANHATTVSAFIGQSQLTYTATSARTMTVSATSANCANPTITPGTVTVDPKVTTTAYTPNTSSVTTNLTSTSAIINGIYNSSGNANTSYRFIYSSDPTFASITATSPGWTSIAGTPSSNTAVSQSLTGLSPNTTYYYQLQIKNSTGTIFNGGTLSFTTLVQQALPTVITQAASKVTTTNATLNGTFNANLTAINGVQFLLCTNSALTAGCLAAVPVVVDDGTGVSTNLTLLANNSGDFVVSSDSITNTQRITTLTGATTYYFQLQVTCTVVATYCPTGTVSGNVLSFTTGAPTAATLDATNIGGTSATLNGSVNANSNSNAAVSFCWNANSAATTGVLNTCTSASASTTPISGSADQTESSAITGLSPGTTYYFQVKVLTTTNVSTYGSILQFTTLGITTASPLTSGAVGSTYAASFAGIGGSNTYTWSTTSTLPSGLTLGSNGLLSGTPTTSGSYSFDITLTDPASGLTTSKTFTITITGDPTTTTSAATNVRFTTATINGTVSPNGTVLTGASFCWGTASNLTGCASVPITYSGFGSLTSNQVTTNITGLAAGTTYYYKVTANFSASSVATSNTGTFTTAAVTTADPSGIGINGATVAGNFVAGSSALANGDVSQSVICYSKASTVGANGLLSSSTTCTTNVWGAGSTLAGGATLTNTRTLAGLDLITQYYYQHQVTFTGGAVGYGAVKTFTTLDGPTATVNSALQVTGKTARIRGAVNPHGNNINKVQFCWGTSNTLSIATCSLQDPTTSIASMSANADNSFDAPLSGLLPGTTYYYLIYAKTGNFLTASSLRFRAASVTTFDAIINQLSDKTKLTVAKGKKAPKGKNSVVLKQAATASSDTVQSTSSSFTTAGAVTNNATDVTHNAATLNGTLTASSSGLTNTDVKSVKLCYSTTNNLNAAGQLADTPVCSSSLWGGSQSLTGVQAANFSTNVTGLTQGTNYYEQMQVLFYDDTVLNGNPLLFTTALPQVPTVSSATSISSTTATMQGSVDAKGTTLTSVKFCYDTTTAFTNCAAHTYTITAPAGGWTTGVNPISYAVTGLTSSTTYYYKVLTVSNLASIDSSYTSFTTLSLLNFNSQLGSAVQSVEYATGATVNLSTAVSTRTGYTFRGWFVASSGGNAVGSTYSPPGTTDTILYAQWSQDSYTVNYNTQGGNTINSTTYVYGGTISNPGTPVQLGYTFVGWFTAGTGGTQYTFPYQTSGTGTITMYAHWTKDTYTVQFVPDNGGTVASQTYQINGTISQPAAITKLGYSFQGWYDASSGGNLISFSLYPSAGTTGDITLYARWTKDVYDVVYDSNGGTSIATSHYSIGDSITDPGNPTRDGYTFQGWFTLAAGGTKYTFPYQTTGTGTITLQAQWQLVTYNVTFDEQGGSLVNDTTYTINTYVAAPNPNTTRPGYRFDGWYNGSTPVTFTNYPTSGTTGNIALTAHWTAYTVTFTAGSGSGTPPGQLSGSITLPDQGSMVAPTNTTFGGWQCPEGTATLSVGTTFNPTSSVTCVAIWNVIGSNTVTFHKNFGGSTDTSSQSTNIFTNLTANSFAVTGYTFLYWCKASGSDTSCGSGNQVADMAGYDFTLGNLDLYAIWRINSYVTTFNSNYGATPATTTSTDNYNTVIDLNTHTLSRTGYTFTGWSTTNNGTALSGYTVTSSQTLYAVWTINSYTITYHNNFGTDTTSAMSYNFGDTTALTYNKPTGANWTNDGYTFQGWATTNSATTAATSYSVSANAHLYAVWTIINYTISYSPNHDTLPSTDQNFNYGATTALSSAPTITRTGYTFQGWATTSSGTVLTSYTVTQAQTFYAQWTLNTYLITYRNNFGTPTTVTQTYSYGDNNALSFGLPAGANWIKTGSTFVGWATTSGATSAATSYTVTGAASLYAVWSLNSYNILYDKNDGSVTPATTTASFNYGATNALNYSSGFTRTGYSFAGWTDTGRTGDVISTYTVQGAATLYARWTPSSNSVIFNPQNGTANITSTYLTGGTINDPGVIPYLAGNHFDGWALTSNGAVETLPYLPGTVGIFYMYGQWTPWVVTFALGSGGGTSASGTAPNPMSGVIAHLPGQGSMTGPTNYFFTGWVCTGAPTVYPASASITPTGNTTCTAQWSLNADKTITFHSNYPVGTNTTTVQTSSAAANLNPNPFVAGGYSFIGWSLTPTGSVAYGNRANYDFLLDGDLYAKWVQVEPNLPVYIINFEYQGGDGSVVVTYYRFGDPGIVLPTATRPGYNFTGWTTEPNNSQSVNAPFITNQNVKLFAQWAPKQITVKFDYQGGTQGVTEMNYKVGDPGLTLPTNTTKPKLYFGGWAEMPGGSDPVAEPFSPSENVTLYAIWNGTKIIVTLDPANGQPVNKLTYVIGGKPLQLPPMVNVNFSFIGWNNATNAITGLPNPYKPTRNITLYPVWKEPDASTKVIFTGDSSVLTAPAKKILQSLSKKVAQSTQYRQLVVDGWVKETLNKSYDMQLSNQRALKTAAYLKSLGVDAFARLTPRGISPENTFESRRANVSIFYSGPKKK